MSGGDPHGGSGSTSASNTQYGGECNINNGNGNVGDGNGAGAENNACNENTFITENNNSVNDHQHHQHQQRCTTNNNHYSTRSAPHPAASSGVLGCQNDQSAQPA